MPYLSSGQRDALKNRFDNSPLGQLRARDKAIARAWDLHATQFPNSRKRLFFAILLVIAVLSVVADAIWLNLH